MRKYLLHCIDLLKKNKSFDLGSTSSYICQRLCATLRSEQSQELISYGFNRSFSGHYCVNSDKYRICDFVPSIHAEANAINKAKLHKSFSHKVNNSVLYIARLKNKQGDEIGCAKPCIFCLKYIIQNNIKKIYFTIDNDTYGILNCCGNNSSILTQKIDEYLKTQQENYTIDNIDSKLDYSYFNQIFDQHIDVRKL